MKKIQTKKRVVFMLLAFVLLLAVMYWVNRTNNQTLGTPEDFIIKDSVEQTTSKESTESEERSTMETSTSYQSTYNGEQDIASQFAATYLQFSAKSMEQVKPLIDPVLSSKLEQVKGEEQVIDSLSLLDRSTVDDKNIYVYTFKCTLTDSKKTKKTGKLFVIMKPDEEKTSVVSDVEWTYET